jgi:hypothetical protein
MFSEEEELANKPVVGEAQEAYILRVTREVCYDPELIKCTRQINFAHVNQLNLNGFAKWTNVLEYDKPLPLNAEKSMRVLETSQKIPIAIFMKRSDL